MSAPTVGSERNTNDRTVHRGQPSPRPATRPANRSRPVAPNQRPQRERTNLSAEARGQERSNVGNALSGLAGLGETRGVGISGRVGLGASLDSAPVRGTQDHTSDHRRGPGWRVSRGDNPHLNDNHIQTLDSAGAEYQRRTGQELVITSGERDSHRTVDAWLHTPGGNEAERAAERRHLYGEQRAFGLYQGAWDQAMSRHGNNPEAARPDFERSVEGLMRDQRFISNHQTGDSFDISVGQGNMSNRDVQIVTDIFRRRGWDVTDEGNHVHVDRPRNQRRMDTTADPTIDESEARLRNRNQRIEDLQNPLTMTPRELATRLLLINQPYMSPVLGDGIDPNQASIRIFPTRRGR